MPKTYYNSNGHLVGSLDQTPRVLTAGENISALDVVLIDTTTDKLRKYDASNQTDCQAIIGIAVSGGSTNDSITVILSGIVGGFSSLDVGTIYYSDPDTATIGVAADIGGTQWTRGIGQAISATEIMMRLNPVTLGP